MVHLSEKSYKTLGVQFNRDDIKLVKLYVSMGQDIHFLLCCLSKSSMQLSYKSNSLQLRMEMEKSKQTKPRPSCRKQINPRIVIRSTLLEKAEPGGGLHLAS